MFILATTELQKVPATILSRCQRHSFRRIEAQTLAKYLETVAAKEQLSLSPEAAELIARLAEGGVRDALSLLDQCSASENIDAEAVYSTIGLAGKRRIGELLDSVLRHDIEAALRLFSALWMEGKDPASLLGELNTLLRDVLMLHVAPKGALDLLSGGFDTRTLNGFAGRMTTEELLCAMGTVQNTLTGLRDAKNPRMAAELCLVSLCSDTAGESLSQLRARISRLEEQLERGLPAPGAERRERERAPTPLQPENDELEVFQEEQPEDVICKRSEPALEPLPEEPPTDRNLWKEIREKATPMLPVDIRLSLQDENRVTGRLEGKVLTIEATPGFLFNRFNRQDVLGRFAEAGRAVTGGDVNVQLRELKIAEREKRSLDELRQFKEVHFVE